MSFPDLVLTQPTLLRLLPKLGLTTQASLDLLCLGGIILAFVAMISKAQRNCFVFGFLWMFYFSIFQVKKAVIIRVFLLVLQLRFPLCCHFSLQYIDSFCSLGRSSIHPSVRPSVHSSIH